jgi:hypothetical protein
MMVSARPQHPQRPLWIKCPACLRCWQGAMMPIDVEGLARLNRDHGHCGKCGTPTVIAQQRGGFLLEPEGNV